VPLHLGEHLVVVQRAAHGFEFSYSRYTVFLVPVLSSNEKGSTSDELVVALVHDTAGAVAVEKVDSEKQSLRQQLEGGVSFDQKVKEVWAHEPLDLSLNVNGIDVR
jgi:hypothetical protein